MSVSPNPFPLEIGTQQKSSVRGDNTPVFVHTVAISQVLFGMNPSFPLCENAITAMKNYLLVKSLVLVNSQSSSASVNDSPLLENHTEHRGILCRTETSDTSEIPEVQITARTKETHQASEHFTTVQISSVQLSSIQLSSAQLRSVQIRSDQFRSVQLRSLQIS